MSKPFKPCVRCGSTKEPKMHYDFTPDTEFTSESMYVSYDCADCKAGTEQFETHAKGTFGLIKSLWNRGCLTYSPRTIT